MRKETGRRLTPRSTTSKPATPWPSTPTSTARKAPAGTPTTGTNAPPPPTAAPLSKPSTPPCSKPSCPELGFDRGCPHLASQMWVHVLCPGRPEPACTARRLTQLLHLLKRRLNALHDPQLRNAVARLDLHRRRAQVRHHHLDLAAIRSEERRVGKECRSRWSP